MRLFKRSGTMINLRGAKTPNEINRRIHKALNRPNPKITPGWRNLLKNILPYFGKFCIDEAIANPHGRVALTLKYGSKKAERILERRALTYLEFLQEKAKRKRKRRKKS